MPNYLITARNVTKGKFGSEPGPARFLKVPANRSPSPAHKIARKAWVSDIMSKGHTGQDPHTGVDCGDIVVFVHGYNTSPADVVRRHRQLERDLPKAGFDGAIVSFDWPSNDEAINYLEDRRDAKITALNLVDDCISLMAATQLHDCRINVHVVAHSMGAYVVREAFDDADDRPAIAASNWNVSQLCFVGADVSARSMAKDDARSRSLYRHCTRLTNYQNPYDSVLKLSDIKRAGVAPRAGRRGLPDTHPAKAVNVNCGDHFARHYAKSGEKGHSWYFTDTVFIADLVQTLSGNRDRSVVGQRRIEADGSLVLA